MSQPANRTAAKAEKTTFWLAGQPLILASASTARRQMLEQAGVPVQARPATLDERQVEKDALASGASIGSVAGLLADAKALAVSRQCPGHLVLGADQTLVCAECLLHKAVDTRALRQTLSALSGRTHMLTSAFTIARDHAVLMRGEDAARLTVRTLTQDFIDRYVAAEGAHVLGSVGGYHLEGAGAQLFTHINGSYFTILGLPLLPILAALRGLGALVE